MNSRFITGIRTAFLVIAWLYVAAILFQVLLIGLNLFAGEATREAHIGFGHTVGLLPLLMLILAFVGRMPVQAKQLAVLQFVLVLIQAEVFAAIRGQFPVLASFHPVLAMVVFAVAALVAARASSWVQAPIEAPATVS